MKNDITQLAPQQIAAISLSFITADSATPEYLKMTSETVKPPVRDLSDLFWSWIFFYFSKFERGTVGR